MSIANDMTSCDGCGQWLDMEDMVFVDGFSYCEECSEKNNL